MPIAEQIRELAQSLGIDALGFAEAAEFEGYAIPGSSRRDPRLSMRDARTIIAAGIYIGGFALPSWDSPSAGRTSRLFLSGFFNDVVKPLFPIAELLRKEGYAAIICDGSKNNGSVLPLKLAAVRAGLGWQGKHSLLISRKFGTFLALGGIITNAELPHNKAEEKDRCKTCGLCRQACPVHALDRDYVLNKKRCLSFLMQNDNFPEEAKQAKENRVIDCEICQEACPWNAAHIGNPLQTPLTESFKGERLTWDNFYSLQKLGGLTAGDYKKMLGPLNTGIPFSVFRRNVNLAAEYLRKKKEKPPAY